MDIEHVQFPLARSTGRGLKSASKAWLGRLMLLLMGARAAQLERGQVGERLDLRDRLLLAALVRRHEQAGTLEQLNGLHDWLWSSAQAVNFHEQAQVRFESWWLQQHSAIVDPLLAELEQRPGRYSALCEIGCGSGLVLHDLARRLPQLQRFIGLDLSAAQTQRNRSRYAGDPRLHFDSGDAAAWVEQHAASGRIYLTNAGVLEYFPEPKLRRMLRHIAQRQSPAAFAIAEPVDQAHDLERDLASYSYGPERSWSHHYPHLFRDCGFELRWQRELQFAGLRWVLLLARVH